MTDPWPDRTPAELLALAIARLDGWTTEATIRTAKPSGALVGIRVVAVLPDPDAAHLLAALAEALGARLEPPEGTIVGFWLSPEAGVFPGALSLPPGRIRPRGPSDD